MSKFIKHQICSWHLS